MGTGRHRPIGADGADIGYGMGIGPATEFLGSIYTWATNGSRDWANSKLLRCATRSTMLLRVTITKMTRIKAEIVAKRANMQMTAEDLCGYTVAELECKQCGGTFCGARVGRLYDGKPLIMCGRKSCVKEVLSHEHRACA